MLVKIPEHSNAKVFGKTPIYGLFLHRFDDGKNISPEAQGWTKTENLPTGASTSYSQSMSNGYVIHLDNTSGASEAYVEFTFPVPLEMDPNEGHFVQTMLYPVYTPASEGDSHDGPYYKFYIEKSDGSDTTNRISTGQRVAYESGVKWYHDYQIGSTTGSVMATTYHRGWKHTALFGGMDSDIYGSLNVIDCVNYDGTKFKLPFYTTNQRHRIGASFGPTHSSWRLRIRFVCPAGKEQTWRWYLVNFVVGLERNKPLWPLMFWGWHESEV